MHQTNTLKKIYCWPCLFLFSLHVDPYWCLYGGYRTFSIFAAGDISTDMRLLGKPLHSLIFLMLTGSPYNWGYIHETDFTRRHVSISDYGEQQVTCYAQHKGHIDDSAKSLNLVYKPASSSTSIKYTKSNSCNSTSNRWALKYVIWHYVFYLNFELKMLSRSVFTSKYQVTFVIACRWFLPLIYTLEGFCNCRVLLVLIFVHREYLGICCIHQVIFLKLSFNQLLPPWLYAPYKIADTCTGVFAIRR